MNRRQEIAALLCGFVAGTVIVLIACILFCVPRLHRYEHELEDTTKMCAETIAAYKQRAESAELANNDARSLAIALNLIPDQTRKLRGASYCGLFVNVPSLELEKCIYTPAPPALFIDPRPYQKHSRRPFESTPDPNVCSHQPCIVPTLFAAVKQ